MTVHARRVASVPRRTSVDTWTTIVELVTTTGTAARAELLGITGLGAAAIAEEFTSDAPIIVSGTGPQVRVYTTHGDAAVEADVSDERTLSHDPTDGDWTLSMPCADEDLDDFGALAAGATHVVLRPLSEDVSSERTEAQASARPIINLAALEQP
jgi:hypothetical protein